MAQEIIRMDLKKLFATIEAVLFSYRSFWDGHFTTSKTGTPGGNVLKDYSVPVIAMVQLVKFPVIGIPRQAMIVAIATFLVDIAALYLITGGMARFIDAEGQSQTEERMTSLAGFSLTPVWLAEPFYFIDGWNWLLAALAICYALLICRSGFLILGERYLQPATARPVMRNSALLFVTVCAALFLVERGILRLFNELPI